MRNKNYAINICLIPERELFWVCKTLNSLDTESEYNTNSRIFIPHATLVMKYVWEEELREIIEQIQKLKIQKIDTKIEAYYAKYVQADDCWTGIYLEKNPEIIALQDSICSITKKFENRERTRDFYAIDDFFEENQIPLWDEEDFQSKDEIHITLGKTDISKKTDTSLLPKKTVFEKIVVGHMWNYGSVREILFEKDL